jgi:hypothetical protein
MRKARLTLDICSTSTRSIPFHLNDFKMAHLQDAAFCRRPGLLRVVISISTTLRWLGILAYCP